MACKSVRSLSSGRILSTCVSHHLANEQDASEGPSHSFMEEEREKRRRKRSKRKGRRSPDRSDGGERKRKRRSRVLEEEEEGGSGESLAATSFEDISSSSSLSLSQGEAKRRRQHSRGPRRPPNSNPASTPQTSGLTCTRASFEEKYVELNCLGRGGYGSVYAGYRREDNLPVAVKHVSIAQVLRTPVTLDGKLSEFPMEVVLLLIAGQGREVRGQTGVRGGEGGPGRAVVGLLDWYELEQELILVLERPVPSMDLFDYVEERGGYLPEDEAKNILRQLVEAMIDIHSKGVLHRDIKPENILIETGSDSPRVRIVDFGCGCIMKKGPYTDFVGTTQYTPPEWYLHASYQAVTSTVWQLGVVLYDVICGENPFNTRREIISEEPYIRNELSRHCQDLLRRCLAKRPKGRPSLEGMLLHPWLQ